MSHMGHRILKTFNWQILQMAIQYMQPGIIKEELIKVLEKESKSAIDWFKLNDMIVNPNKFQAMIMRCDLNMNNSIIISSVDSAIL